MDTEADEYGEGAGGGLEYEGGPVKLSETEEDVDEYCSGVLKVDVLLDVLSEVVEELEGYDSGEAEGKLDVERDVDEFPYPPACGSLLCL